jgi:hypothetical protein
MYLTERAMLSEMLQGRSRDADGDGRIESIEGLDGKPIALDPPTNAAEILKLGGAAVETLLKLENERYPAARKSAEVQEGSLSKHKGLADIIINTRIDTVRRVREAHLNGARAVLRMHLVKANSGNWPATLKDAMAGETPTMRWDPFSDGELVYKLVKGEPLLYSLGKNGTDDGGARADDTAQETGDLVFWPPAR